MRDQYARPFLCFAFTVNCMLVYLPTSSFASKCILFNFGDSNSDTGAMTAGLGLYLGPPSGQEFFHKQTGRFCNGRLYIDFICQNLNMTFLSPYLESSGSDYSHGANFAVSGAFTDASLWMPFSLAVQTQQFVHFQSRTRELRPKGKGSKISETEFQNAVFSIDIGQNDITVALVQSNFTFQQFQDKIIPLILGRIESAAAGLYKAGARKFWFYNTGPMGCLPQTLALRQQNDSEFDKLGCMSLYNNAAIALNAGLSKLCDKLTSNLKNATIILTDMYAIKYDLFANPDKYGFQNPLMACCGSGGPPYNYEDKKTCGEPTASACPDPSRSVSWDGVHYTEAANAVVASKILSGNYSTPSIKLNKLCKS